MVEVRESHSAPVEFIENRSEPVEQGIVEPGSLTLPQWLGIDPFGGQGKGSDAPEKSRQDVESSRGFIRCSLAPYQPSAETVSNRDTSRLIRLDSHPRAIQIIEKQIGFRTVTSHKSSNRLVSRDRAEIDGPSVPGV